MVINEYLDDLIKLEIGDKEGGDGGGSDYKDQIRFAYDVSPHLYSNEYLDNEYFQLWKCIKHYNILGNTPLGLWEWICRWLAYLPIAQPLDITNIQGQKTLETS